MTPRSVSTPGKLEIGTGGGLNWSLVNNNEAISDIVICPAVSHGDFKTPQPWNYIVARSKRAKIVDSEMWECRGRNGNPSQQWEVANKFRGTLDWTMVGHFVPQNQDTQCYNVALGRLNEKVRGGLDLSTALAESSQTFRMLNNIRKVERHFKSLGGRRWADEWLELSYGWLPLLSDLYKSAGELLEVAPTFAKFTGSAKLAEQSSHGSRIISTSTDLTGIGTRLRENVDTKPIFDRTNICKFTVNLKPPSSIQGVSRWTSLNPLTIAWELMPYSFVIDWLIDVGSYLRDTETAFLYNSAFQSGFVSEIWAYKVAENIAYNSHGSGIVPEGNVVTKLLTKAERDALVFKRTVLTSYPLPRLPSVKTDFSWRRHISAAALLAQFLPRQVVKTQMASIDRILGKRSYQTSLKNQYDFAELR